MTRYKMNVLYVVDGKVSCSNDFLVMNYDNQPLNGLLPQIFAPLLNIDYSLFIKSKGTHNISEIVNVSTAIDFVQSITILEIIK